MRDHREPDLIELFRGGDAAAFDELLRRHAPALRARFERRMPALLRRRISADDLVQDTCLAAHGARMQFEDRGDSAFLAWLTGIADHRLLDALRRHASAAKRSTRREVTRGARPETAYLVALQRTPSAVAAGAEQVARLREAMRKLSPDDREVLRLALEEGLSLREVAGRMGRSREAAKKLYGRAVCRLRALVETDDGA